MGDYESNLISTQFFKAITVFPFPLQHECERPGRTRTTHPLQLNTQHRVSSQSAHVLRYTGKCGREQILDILIWLDPNHVHTSVTQYGRMYFMLSMSYSIPTQEIRPILLPHNVFKKCWMRRSWLRSILLEYYV